MHLTTLNTGRVTNYFFQALLTHCKRVDFGAGSTGRSVIILHKQREVQLLSPEALSVGGMSYTSILEALSGWSPYFA